MKQLVIRFTFAVVIPFLVSLLQSEPVFSQAPKGRPVSIRGKITAVEQPATPHIAELMTGQAADGQE